MTSVFKHHAKTAPNLTTRKVSSKNVQYKIFDTNGGYGYFYFTNNETKFNYNTTVTLAQCKNVKIVYPGQSEKLTLTISPGKSKIVLYEATGFPYSTSMKIASSFSEAPEVNNMIKSTLSFGKKTILDNQVTQSVTNHTNGINIVFENNSNDIYSMFVKFRLDGCHIEGVVGDSMNLMIHPCASKSLRIRKDAFANTFSAKIIKAEGTKIPCYDY